MPNSLKKRTSLAIFWSFLDKGGQQLIQLVFGVILARILLPSEIGVLALLAIFIAVANILQESGFSAALIRKREPSKEDFSSVFYFNVSISIAVYLLFFLCAPLIADFYKNPILTNLARVAFLSFLFSSFGIIQNVILVRKMDFKTNTQITLISSSIAGIVAITMALAGYSVWSLVAQLVIQSFLRSALLWIFIKWRPQAGFHSSNIKKMSSYSLKLLATSLMNQICSRLYTNIIGKVFSAHQAGIYDQGYKYGILPQTVISDGIRAAAFPSLSKINHDLAYTKKIFRKIVRITAFISFPVAFIIIVIAKPAILLLITSKWTEAIPILQIAAIGAAFYPLYGLVATLLQTIAKTGLILKLEIFRNALSLILIFVTIKYGVHALVMGASAVSIIAFIAGMTIAGKHIKYSPWEILKDTFPYGLIAAASILPFIMLEYCNISNLFALLLIPSIIGFSIYLGILKLAKAVILDDTIAFFKQLIKQSAT